MVPVFSMLPQQNHPGANQPVPVEPGMGPSPIDAQRLVDILSEIEPETGVDAGLKLYSKLAETVFRLNLPKTVIVKGVLGSAAATGEEDRIYLETKQLVAARELAKFQEFLARARAVAGLRVVWSVVNQPVAFRDP